MACSSNRQLSLIYPFRSVAESFTFIYLLFYISFYILKTAESYEAYHTPLVHSGRKGSGFMTGKHLVECLFVLNELFLKTIFK